MTRGNEHARPKRYELGDLFEIVARFGRDIWQRALAVPSDVNGVELVARAMLWTGLLLMSWHYVFQSIVRSQMSPNFIHFIVARINTVFHEAGHIIFMPFGRFMSVLGGSLLQVLIPFVIASVFLLRHRNAFGASVTLWWTGQSLIDLAPYIADAREQQLVLLGGVTGLDAPGYHDWNNLLRWTGLLHMDLALANAAHVTGAALVVAALVWGGWLLWRQYDQIRD